MLRKIESKDLLYNLELDDINIDRTQSILRNITLYMKR